MAALYTRGRAMEVENRIARRRNQEEAMRRRWENHWNYLQRLDVQSTKRAAWFAGSSSRPGSARGSESRRVEEEREEKRKRLEERRGRLRRLLDEEREGYEVELRELTPDKVKTMKTRVDHLKSQRMERQKALAEEKHEEIWRANCPKLRQAEVRQREKAMPSMWQEQVSAKTQKEESSKKEKERYQQEVEKERERALRKEEEQKKKMKSEGRDHATALQRQMMEVKAREEEAAQLEVEQAQIEKEQLELAMAEERRERLEETARKAELGRVLSKQATAQLRRKSQRIQEALELDLRILEDIAERERVERGLATERRERARADAQWMRQVVAEQLELEKKREAELDLLHR
ncbi:Trichoplein keratin filament-binding protein [Geodia barretti]|nr:Trichoplein keratin filament-binding protein [Geodia barretti]